MRIGIPIDEDRGLESPVCGHFGGAPAFLVVDTDQGTLQTLMNDHGHESHGQCVPVDLLRAQRLDAMIVAGIGRGALTRLAALDVRVCRAEHATAGACVAALAAGGLEDIGLELACAGHDHAPHGHSHS